MSYIEEFIHKLNLIPPEADKLLRQIRELDKRVEEMKANLQEKRETFLGKLAIWERKKTAKGHLQVQNLFKEISKHERDIVIASREKIQIAEKLYNFIHEPTQRLDRELQAKGIDQHWEEEDPNSKRKRGKKTIRKGAKRGEWQYDPNEPVYCYCGKPSFGEMVACQNTFCKREWFHLDCLEEKKLPQKWFCRQCRVTQLKNGIRKN